MDIPFDMLEIRRILSREPVLMKLVTDSVVFTFPMSRIEQHEAKLAKFHTLGDWPNPERIDKAEDICK
jgi:hypothetical protein